MSKNDDEKFLDQLSGDAKTQAKKMSPKQLIQVSRQVTALYNLACVSCKNKMRNNPQKFKNFEDLCDGCRGDVRIVACFKRMEDIHHGIV